MKSRKSLFALALFSVLCAGPVLAQLPPFGDTILLPVKPTSADNLKLSLRSRTCGGFTPYKANPYRVSMAQNNIVVTLGERVIAPVPLCPPAPREEIDLGRLPAGDYTLTVIETTRSAPAELDISNAPFTVADARVAKTAPYVRLDYSGHWWDANDSGWGLFIWQDARDNLLVAWFTYTADGKPMWYVFQPRWQSATHTLAADLIQTSRPPGATSPPAGPTSMVVVGTANLDFTNFGTPDEGKLTYTITGGPTQVRSIQRFKP